MPPVQLALGATIVTGAALAAAAPPASAAALPVDWNCTSWSISTQYGELAMCIEFRANRSQGRPTIHSLDNGSFSPSGDGTWLTVAGGNPQTGTVVSDDSGIAYPVRAGGALASSYGVLIYGTQFWADSGFGPLGRWGVWNLSTNRFYPSTGWYPVPIH